MIHLDLVVLLAAYNGERYLPAQIQSILDQSWSDWKLFIRDDGSCDGTRDVALGFAERFPDKIFVFPQDQKRLGADGNFSYLLENVEADYYMFCDQDDVWLPDKIEKTIQCMRNLEVEHGENTPLLAHTDLRVVDENLNELDSSVWHFGHHDPECSRKLNRLLVQNMVFGCTTMINSELKKIAAPIPEGVVQYDYWLALVVVCLGAVGYVSEPTSLYRQHGKNSVGAANWGFNYIFRKCLSFFDEKALLGALEAYRRQAAILLDRYHDRLNFEQQEMIRAYVNIERQGFIEKRITLLKYGFFKTGLVRNIGLFLRI